MSYAEYNGFRLPWLRTESYVAEVAYNGPDYLYTKHAFTLDLLIARGTPSLYLSGETTADVIRRVRHALETPRRPFRFVRDGEPVLEADSTSDVNHGPMPEVVGFTDFVGSESVHVRFRVTVCKRECDGRGEQVPEYLSNRWEESVDIGDDFRTVYRRSGSLVIASNARLNGRPVSSVDEYRFLVVPKMPVGFTLKHFSFAASPDGLTLAYTIEYEERDAGTMPPPPAVKAEGSCVVSTTNGAKFFAQVTVRLTGHPRSSKMALMATAIAVAMHRLERAGPRRGPGTGRWLITGQMSEQLYANVVEVQLRTLLDSQDRYAAEMRTDPSRPFGQQGGTKVADSAGSGIGPGSDSANAGFPVPSTAEQLAREIEEKLKTKTTAKPGDKPPDGSLVPKALVPFGFGESPLYSRDAGSPDPGLRATAGLRLIAALINDPCVRPAELSGLTGTLTELIASAPGGDLTRYLAGIAARTSTLTARIVPDLDEVVRTQQQKLSKPPGASYTYYDLTLVYRNNGNMSFMTEQRENGLTHGVPLAGKQISLTVTWKTQRVGDAPVIPQENLGDDNAMYDDGEHNGGGSVELAADGQTLLITSAGWYRFVFKDPTKVKYGAAIVPWLAALVGKPAEPVITGGPELVEIERQAELGTSGTQAGASDRGQSRWRQLWLAWVGLFRPPNR